MLRAEGVTRRRKALVKPPTLLGRPELVEPKQLPDVLQRQPDLLAAADEMQARRGLLVVDPVLRGCAPRPGKQAFQLVKADRVTGDPRSLRQLADPDSFDHSSHGQDKPWTGVQGQVNSCGQSPHCLSPSRQVSGVASTCCALVETSLPKAQDGIQPCVPSIPGAEPQRQGEDVATGLDRIVAPEPEALGVEPDLGTVVRFNDAARIHPADVKIGRELGTRADRWIEAICG